MIVSVRLGRSRLTIEFSSHCGQATSKSFIMEVQNHKACCRLITLCPPLLHRMTTFLENFLANHPGVTLSHTEYGKQFCLGNGINILSLPSQRVQTFVENEGAPYRFMIVGQLMSFKVVEDAVRCHFFSFEVCLSEVCMILTLSGL